MIIRPEEMLLDELREYIDNFPTKSNCDRMQKQRLEEFYNLRYQLDHQNDDINQIS